MYIIDDLIVSIGLFVKDCSPQVTHQRQQSPSSRSSNGDRPVRAVRQREYRCKWTTSTWQVRDGSEAAGAAGAAMSAPSPPAAGCPPSGTWTPRPSRPAPRWPSRAPWPGRSSGRWRSVSCPAPSSGRPPWSPSGHSPHRSPASASDTPWSPGVEIKWFNLISIDDFARMNKRGSSYRNSKESAFSKHISHLE